MDVKRSGKTMPAEVNHFCAVKDPLDTPQGTYQTTTPHNARDKSIGRLTSKPFRDSQGPSIFPFVVGTELFFLLRGYWGRRVGVNRSMLSR